MRYIRRADERGSANFGWLNSHHSFSFGRYYDPEHMGISVLRVINDDTVQPGRGFETHGHRDMEIISYVIDGALAHKDSTGNSDVIPAGDIQRMSAGKGITHSEFNASESEPVHFLQIWILPAKQGITPGYQQKTIVQHQAMTPLLTPLGDGGTLSVNQDVTVYRLRLEPGQAFSLSTQERIGYLHIVKGSAEIDNEPYAAGDGMGMYQNDEIKINANFAFEALWFDLPQV